MEQVDFLLLIGVPFLQLRLFLIKNVLQFIKTLDLELPIEDVPVVKAFEILPSRGFQLELVFAYETSFEVELLLQQNQGITLIRNMLIHPTLDLKILQLRFHQIQNNIRL